MTQLRDQYARFGISEQAARFGEEILSSLTERFRKIDETAEYNQLKVIHAMQACKVSEACLLGTTGYGYNDLGRDTLEQVYAEVFPGTPADHLWHACACACPYE